MPAFNKALFHSRTHYRIFASQCPSVLYRTGASKSGFKWESFGIIKRISFVSRPGRDDDDPGFGRGPS